MRTVQADSCLHSEQIDTLLMSVGGQEGGLGGGGILGRRPKKCTWVSGNFFCILLAVAILSITCTWSHSPCVCAQACIV